jgi:hypothetical protein
MPTVVASCVLAADTAASGREQEGEGRRESVGDAQWQARPL